MGFLGTGDSAPPPPDYAAQARAQGEANKDAAYQTTVLSNPNIYTPTGSQTTTWGPANQGATRFNFDSLAKPAFSGRSLLAYWWWPW